MLQKPESNINKSTKITYNKILNKVIKFLNNIRWSEEFNRYIRDAQVLDAEINISAKYAIVRNRTKIRHLSYEYTDEILTNPKKIF